MEPIKSSIQQLKAAEQLSENAVVEVLNIIGELQNVVSAMPENDTKNQCNALIAKLYEICTFQDLASQHLTRAENTLHEVAKNGHLNGCAAPTDSSLLRGPAIAGEASVSQADVDRLISGNPSSPLN